jgi:hypothetical protein
MDLLFKQGDRETRCVRVRTPYGQEHAQSVLTARGEVEKRGENVGCRWVVKPEISRKGKASGERHFHRQWQIFDMFFRITVEEATGEYKSQLE